MSSSEVRLNNNTLMSQLEETMSKMNTAISSANSEPYVAPPSSASNAFSSLGEMIDSFGEKGTKELLELSLGKSSTWNGDENWSTLGHDVISKILEFCTKLDSTTIRNANKLTSRSKKRPKQAKHSINDLDKIPGTTKAMWEGMYVDLSALISSQPIKEQALYWNITFRLLFFKRAIVKSGRATVGSGERTLTYWFVRRLYDDFPDTSKALVSLFPHFGYFGDLDKLIGIGLVEGLEDFVDACVKTYAWK